MKMYQILEQDGRKHETYMLGFETDAELQSYLNGKRMWNDEKKYSIVAWEVNSEGYGYVDFERIWKMYSLKTA